MDMVRSIDSALDESVLRTLREVEADGAPGLVNLLATAFVEDASDRLRQLAAGVTGRHFLGIKQAAHSLKGMCGTIGALHMEALSLALENPELRVDAQGALLRELEVEFARVQAALTTALVPSPVGQA